MLVNYGARPIGALSIGALAGAAGPRIALLTASLLGTFGVVPLLTSGVRQLRSLDELCSGT